MPRGGIRVGAGRPSTGRIRKVLYITNDETLKVRDFIANLRSGGISTLLNIDVLQSKAPTLTPKPKHCDMTIANNRINELLLTNLKRSAMADTLNSEGITNASWGTWTAKGLNTHINRSKAKEGNDGREEAM